MVGGNRPAKQWVYSEPLRVTSGPLHWCPLVRELMAAILLFCHHPLGLLQFYSLLFLIFVCCLTQNIFTSYMLLLTLEVYSPQLPCRLDRTHGHVSISRGSKVTAQSHKGLAQLSHPFPIGSWSWTSGLPRPPGFSLFHRGPLRACAVAASCSPA